MNRLTPYQPGKPVEDVRRSSASTGSIELASNEGPFGPFRRRSKRSTALPATSNRYPDGGSYRLHEALAARHGVASDETAWIQGGAGAST